MDRNVKLDDSKMKILNEKRTSTFKNSEGVSNSN